MLMHEQTVAPLLLTCAMSSSTSGAPPASPLPFLVHLIVISCARHLRNLQVRVRTAFDRYSVGSGNITGDDLATSEWPAPVMQ